MSKLTSLQTLGIGFVAGSILLVVVFIPSIIYNDAFLAAPSFVCFRNVPQRGANYSHYYQRRFHSPVHIPLPPGTTVCHLYAAKFDLATEKLTVELLQSCSGGPITGLAFPRGMSDVVLTCGQSSIRCWHLDTGREVVRVEVPNLECHCVAYTTVRLGMCIF